MRPTKRALDAGDSAAFFDSFLASGFSCSRIESTPAPAPSNANRWAVANQRVKYSEDYDEF